MKKFNWGHGILVVIILFLTGIAALVYISMQQNNSVELIEDNYYEKELTFQEQINGERNLKALYPDSILLKDTLHTFSIKLPIAASQVDSGFVEFIRPSDKTKDRRFDLGGLSKNGEITLPKSIFIPGLYRFKIRWNSNGTTYVKTKNLMIN